MPKTSDKELTNWQEEIVIARGHRELWMVNWDYWENMYDDNAWGTGPFGKRRRRSKQSDPQFIPQVNEVETICMAILPRTHFYAPVFEVTAVPDNERYIIGAKIWELVSVHLYDLLGMYDSAKENVMDTLLLGGAVHKSGYSYEVESTAYQLGEATTGEPEITNEMVFSREVSPKHFLWDYRVKKWQDARFVAEEIDKPLEEVKKSDLYSNTANLQPTINSRHGITTVAPKRQVGRKNNDTVRLIEIHDMANGKIITLADGHDEILRKDDDYGIPLYTQLTFTPSRPQRFWGKSVVQSVEEHVIRLSKWISYMDSHAMRAGLTKVMIEPHLINKEVIAKLKSQKDFELIPAQGVSEGKPPIQELKFSAVGFEWYNHVNMIHEAIRSQSGVTQQERGKHESGVETAFEFAGLMEASSTRNKQRILELNRFMAQVMDKNLRIVSDNFNPTQICDMIGLVPEYAYMVVPYERMRLKVKYGSTAMAAKEEQFSKLSSFIQATAALGIQLDPKGVVKLLSEALGMEFREKMVLGLQQEEGYRPSPAGQQQLGGGESANLPIQMR